MVEPTKHLYLICGSEGNYKSDMSIWTVAAYADEDMAIAHQQAAAAWITPRMEHPATENSPYDSGIIVGSWICPTTKYSILKIVMADHLDQYLDMERNYDDAVEVICECR